MLDTRQATSAGNACRQATRWPHSLRPVLTKHIGHHAALVLPRLRTLLGLLVRLHICSRRPTHEWHRHSVGTQYEWSRHPVGTKCTGTAGLHSFRQTPATGRLRTGRLPRLPGCARVRCYAVLCYAAVCSTAALIAAQRRPAPLTQQRLLLAVFPVPTHNGLRGGNTSTQPDQAQPP